MPTENERELPRPLTDEEIKTGISHKIAEAVYASLGTTCHLFGKSYPKFKASVKIHYELDDFGRTVEGNRHAEIAQGEVGEGAISQDIEIEIPETPPNQFRKETEQPIPTLVTTNGQSTERRIKYQPRRGRPPKDRE